MRKATPRQLEMENEKPLSAPAALALSALLALLNLTLYGFCFLALLVVGVIVVLDVILLVALARFGMAHTLFPPLKRLFRLGRVIVNSLRLEKGVDYHIPLTQADAPRLFALIRDCSRRVGCAAPATVVLVMSDDAGIATEGYRQGRGKSTLCLGFDLLVTLNEAEIGSILHHEMAHALLVRRGMKNWARKGMARGHQMVSSLRALLAEESRPKPQPANANSGQEGRVSFYTARMLAFFADLIAKAETKLFAAYSRQDEFQADRTAAELSGGQVFSDTLLKTALVSQKAYQLPWMDRVMQSQRDESFTTWLRAHLLPADTAEAAELQKQAFQFDRRSPFDTHPTIEDRFAQAGATLSKTEVSPAMLLSASPLVDWFPDADAIAERLFAHIERMEAEEERKESEALTRWARKKRLSRSMTGAEWGGTILAALGVMLVVGYIALRETEAGAVGLLIIGGALTACGVWLYRIGAPSGPETFAIPEYASWEDSFEKAREMAARMAKQGTYDFTPKGMGSLVPTRRPERLRYWREQGRSALATCDYVAALGCGLQCLDTAKSDPDGLLLAGVAFSCLGNEAVGGNYLKQAIETFQTNPWVNWAVAWAVLATGEYIVAEAYLLSAVERLPPHPTLCAVLGRTQAQRGKTRAAIANLQRAVALDPNSARLRLRLAQTLLGAGKAREAWKELEALERLASSLADPSPSGPMAEREALEDVLGPQEARDTRLALIRAHLMLNHRETADVEAQWTAERHAAPRTLYHIGVSYAKTDHWDEAAAYFHRATAAALYPMAWVGLGAVYAHQKRDEEARACYLGAVHLTQPRVPDSDTPIEALSAALEGLRALREPTEPLLPWELRLNVRQMPAFEMTELHLLILARNRIGALAFADELLAAMYPGAAPAETLLLGIEEAKMDAPTHPTPPGILDWRGLARESL